MSHNKRILKLSNALNVRDLGGLRTRSLYETAYNTFWRGDLCHALTTEDIDLLRSLGITTVVDMRSDDELAERPDPLSNVAFIDYKHIYLVGGERIPTSIDDIHAIYRSMIADSGVISSILRTLLEAPGGVLFHCTAGKDRTGVISAILLMLAGVDKRLIVKDYMLTAEFIKPLIDRYAKTVPAYRRYLIEPQQSVIEYFVNYFMQRCGSAEQYLLGDLGWSSEDVLALQEKLLSGVCRPQCIHGVMKTFDCADGEQYEAIGRFWSEMSSLYGQEQLCGVGCNWRNNRLDYIIGFMNNDTAELSDAVGQCGGSIARLELPTSGWRHYSGKTEKLSELYDAIYADGVLDYEIERFTPDGECCVDIHRA